MQKREIFINFTNHALTQEQFNAAQKIADRILNAKDVIGTESFNLISNDDGGDVLEMVENIAKTIGQIVGEKTAYIHFPISSPRIMAKFFETKGKMGAIPFDPHSGYSYPQFRDCMMENKKHWKTIIDNCSFLFSVSERSVTEETEKDGSVKKVSVFKFKGFSEI